jgi:hypothetical protein
MTARNRPRLSMSEGNFLTKFGRERMSTTSLSVSSLAMIFSRPESERAIAAHAGPS